MGVLVVGQEKNFGALRERLFEGRVSAAAVRAVSEAMAQANPHVDLAALRPGTILSVPDLPEIRDRGPLSLDSTVRERLDAVAAELTDSLGAARDEAAHAEEAAREERHRALAAFDDAFKAAGDDQDLAGALEAARTAIEEEDPAADARFAALGDAVSGWADEIQALRRLAG